MTSGQTLIVEGVHLDPAFTKKMIKKYEWQCLHYFVSINDF